MIVSPMQGIGILLAIGALSLVITLVASRGTVTNKLSFLAADRDVHWRPGSATVAATWIWATGMFIASEQAYLNGWVGLMWFAVPNIACLAIFAWFAYRIRMKHPEGFTLSEYMRTTKSARVHRLYLMTLGGLAVFSSAVNLLAGGLIVGKLTGIPFTLTTLILAGIALGYSLRSGLKASILTDYVQMAIIGVVCLTLTPWVMTVVGMGTIVDGFSGFNGDVVSMFDSRGGAIFWGFGLSVSLSLIGGPFGDQTFWQRAFAMKPSHIKPAFFGGAALFAIVPITMGILGFAAAGAQVVVEDTQLTNLASIEAFLPLWAIVPFLLYVFSGLLSTIDSNLSAAASIAGHDLSKDPADVMRNSRRAMMGLTLAAVLIANIPGITVTQMFIFYGTFRLSTTVPTILALYRDRTSERGMFWGILLANVIGVPLSAYGNLNSIPWMVAGASLTVLALSALIPAFVVDPKPGANTPARNEGRGHDGSHRTQIIPTGS